MLSPHADLCRLPADWKIPAQQQDLQENINSSNPCFNINHTGQAVRIPDCALLKTYLVKTKDSEFQKDPALMRSFREFAKSIGNDRAVSLLDDASKRVGLSVGESTLEDASGLKVDEEDNLKPVKEVADQEVKSPRFLKPHSLGSDQFSGRAVTAVVDDQPFLRSSDVSSPVSKSLSERKVTPVYAANFLSRSTLETSIVTVQDALAEQNQQHLE